MDAGEVQVGADVTVTVIVKPEKASVVMAEPPRAKVAPAVGPQPEEFVETAESQPGPAATPEGRRRGRPKKAVSYGKKAEVAV